MRYIVSVYDGRQHPAVRPIARSVCSTMPEARREAARLLGHRSLRGASTWERYQGGTVYQFGPKTEDNEYDFVVIEAEEASTDATDACALRAAYDV